jgi:hypothetical protein
LVGHGGIVVVAVGAARATHTEAIVVAVLAASRRLFGGRVEDPEPRAVVAHRVGAPAFRR